jgi:uncharacterized protein YgiM (DUF1202 family)
MARAVYVREGVGSDNRAKGIVRRGQRLAVLGRADDSRGRQWLRVGLPKGETGWIAGWFTERIRSAGAAGSRR